MPDKPSVSQFVSSVRELTDPSNPSAPARGMKVIWALAGDCNLDEDSFRQAMATVRPEAGVFKEYCDPVRKTRDWILEYQRLSAAPGPGVHAPSRRRFGQ